MNYSNKHGRAPGENIQLHLSFDEDNQELTAEEREAFFADMRAILSDEEGGES